jgi:hypothetical protein
VLSGFSGDRLPVAVARVQMAARARYLPLKFSGIWNLMFMLL